MSAVLPQLPVALDTQGRVRVSQEQRQVILAELARSGESIPRFAKRTGLKYSTLAAWVARARRVKRSARRAPLRLVEAVVAPAPAAAPLVVHLPGQARLELQAVGQIPLVVALVRALEPAC